jgi:predicted metal-dependent hydrolase
MQPDIQQYTRLFQRGDYFEAHEVLEDRWRATRSPVLQGLIQIAAGCHHLNNGNLHGARTLWTKARAYLAEAGRAPEEGVDPEPLREYLQDALEALPAGRSLPSPLPAALRPPPLLPGLTPPRERNSPSDPARKSR